jgi:hypothetical protein
LQKDPERRLGSVVREGAGSAVRHHPYFKTIEWSALESLQIEPTFVPINVFIFLSIKSQYFISM